MRFVDGTLVKEIADTLQVLPGTVKSPLHDALKTGRASPRAKEFIGDKDVRATASFSA